jgi:hypothetical protein
MSHFWKNSHKCVSVFVQVYLRSIRSTRLYNVLLFNNIWTAENFPRGFLTCNNIEIVPSDSKIHTICQKCVSWPFSCNRDFCSIRRDLARVSASTDHVVALTLETRVAYPYTLRRNDNNLKLNLPSSSQGQELNFPEVLYLLYLESFCQWYIFQQFE